MIIYLKSLELLQEISTVVPIMKDEFSMGSSNSFCRDSSNISKRPNIKWLSTEDSITIYKILLEYHNAKYSDFYVDKSTLDYCLIDALRLFNSSTIDKISYLGFYIICNRPFKIYNVATAAFIMLTLLKLNFDKIDIKKGKLHDALYRVDILCKKYRLLNERGNYMKYCLETSIQEIKNVIGENL